MKNVNWKKLAQVAKSRAIGEIDGHALISSGRIVATDLETTISYPINIPGEAIVDIKTLSKTKFDSLAIEQKDDSRWLIVKNGNAQSKMICDYNPEDFPKPVECEKYWGELTAEDIQNIKTASGFVSNDELRPVMTAVYITHQHIVATDAHRLVWYNRKGKAGQLDLLMPSSVIRKFFTESEYSVYVATKDYEYEKDGKKVKETYVVNAKLVAKNGQEITLRNVDGKYPNFKAVVSSEYTAVSILPRTQLLNAVKLAENFAHQETLKGTFVFEQDSVTLTSEDLDLDKSYTEEIPQKWNIDNPEISFEIGFNLQFIKNILSVNKSPQVEMLLNFSNRHILIDRNILLMPVMLNH